MLSDNLIDLIRSLNYAPVILEIAVIDAFSPLVSNFLATLSLGIGGNDYRADALSIANLALPKLINWASFEVFLALSNLFMSVLSVLSCHDSHDYHH